MHPTRPPGPRSGLFGLGLASRMFKDYPEFHRQLQRDHGDAVYFRLGRYRDYVFSDPELIREVLVTQARSFVRWKRSMRVFALAHGQSVLITEGEVWQRQRRMLQPGFAPRRFDAYARQIGDASARAIDAVQTDGRTPLDFEQAMTALTMDVIMRTLFSSEAPEDAVAAGAAVQVLSRAALNEMFLPFEVPQWVPLPWRPATRRALQALDALVWRLLRERRADPGEHQDLLAMLMSAADEQDPDARLSDQEVRDQCMTMFLAGHETTATGLAWWGWAMASHPEIAHRAAAEVDAALGGRIPGHADLPRLPYLMQTLKETLRLRPPAAALFTREAVEDVQIGPWRLPRGSLVMITPFVVHHDERWFPSAERFDPDRFAPERADSIPRGAYLPFGVGPRVCIGNNFALMEMAQIAAMLLQRFELVRPAQATEPHPRLHVTLKPEGGLRLVLKPRAAARSPAAGPAGAASCPHMHA
jgi:cytochrome P450